MHPPLPAFNASRPRLAPICPRARRPRLPVARTVGPGSRDELKSVSSCGERTRKARSPTVSQDQKFESGGDVKRLPEGA